MELINVNNIKKSFSGDTIFENVSFSIYNNDKIGFIGINGSGKSTLFKIICEDEEYDSGEIIKYKDLKIGYLKQHVTFENDKTIIDEVMEVFEDIIKIEKQLEEIHFDIENGIGNIDSLISRQATLQESFLKQEGMYYKSKIKSTLMGLGFTNNDFFTPISKLSGGQKTRVALCKILLSNANLLLLDEPTNHLDIESIEWLEIFLQNYKGAFIVISHDRYFLDKVTTKTFEIEDKHFHTYNGNYSSYIAQREIEKLTEKRNYDYTTKEIKRLEEVVEQQRRWKHKKNKKTHTIDNTKKAIERLQRNLVEPTKDPETMKFRFKACAGGAQKVLEVENLQIKFNGTTLFENVNLSLKKGEKAFLIGANGCGKTTLLKIILGIYKQNFGNYKIGENIHIGYFDQLKENLHKEKTVINEIWDEYPTMNQSEVRSALAIFLLKGDDVFKKISSLSGGELARVELTKLMLRQINFMIMDEPTNHLDIISKEALENALKDYNGTMLMVSHDRYFINKLADKIFYLTANGIKVYEGNYDSYIKEKNNNSIINIDEIRSDKKDLDYNIKKRNDAQKRKNLNQITKIENLIAETENKINELIKECDVPEVAANYIKMQKIENQINDYQKQLDNYMEQLIALQQIIDESK